MMRTITLGIAAVMVAALAACSMTHKAQPAAKPQASVPVHTIDIPKYMANLPAGPGREAFAAACMSCHTTRYITMQPAWNVAKWEESIRKMMTVYHAPVAEDQVSVIAKYIVTARETNRGSWEVLAANTKPLTNPPEIKLAEDAATRNADLARGAMIYAKDCASCHGSSGKGNGISAANMLPRPSDLTAGKYSVKAMTAWIHQGVPATAMPSFAVLSKDDLRAVVTYSLKLADRMPEVKWASTAPTVDAKALYATNCVSCHGAGGMGDGPAAATASRPPANFHVKQPSLQQAMKIIGNGVPGTLMPEWNSKFNDDQRRALAEYVRSFYTAQ